MFIELRLGRHILGALSLRFRRLTILNVGRWGKIPGVGLNHTYDISAVVIIIFICLIINSPAAVWIIIFPHAIALISLLAVIRILLICDLLVVVYAPDISRRLRALLLLLEPSGIIKLVLIIIIKLVLLIITIELGLVTTVL